MKSMPPFRYAFRNAVSRIGIITITLFLATTPHRAEAGAADGTYKITRISSTFESDGESVKIPQKEIKEALFGIDGITVKKNRIPLFQTEWFQSLKSPELRDVLDSVEITGPRKVRFTRIRKGVFRGQSSEPLLAKFSFNFLESDVPIHLKTSARGTIKGDQLLMHMKVRMSVRDKSPAKEHYIIKGNILITAKRI